MARSHYPGFMQGPLRTLMHAYSAHNKKRRASGGHVGGYTKRRAIGRRGGRNPSVIAQTDTKVGRRVKGRKKVRSIVHRKKSVKVSRKLRKKIKKVIDGVQHKGVYMTVRQGTIGVITQNTSNVEYRTATQGGYTANVIQTKMPDDLGANTRHWWGGAHTSNDGFTNGDEFQFFTPLKILDAASVLWNQKFAAADYSLQARNLNTKHNQTTGALVVGSVTSMEIFGLKIHIRNAYVKWTLKNNSQRSMRIEMYKCVPTSKNPLSTPLNTFVDACAREGDATNSALVSVVGPFASAKDDLVAMPGVEPNTFKSFNNEWKYEKVILKVAPGETTVAYCQGPKDYVLDFDKLNKGGISVQHLAFKQTSMQVMFAITPDLTFATANVDPNDGQTGRWIANQTVLGNVGDPISIEFQEVFSLSMPDIVGFQNGPATDAGNMYTLNKRLQRRAYANFVGSHEGAAGAVYTSFDEDQPGTAIVQSRTS